MKKPNKGKIENNGVPVLLLDKTDNSKKQSVFNSWYWGYFTQKSIST
ncbi:MAG: hypothetical protein ACI9Q4_001393 [Sediminicola sp.]|jgi:hypothetical protein